MYRWCHESRNYTFVNLKATKISKRCIFVLVTWPWRLPEEWPEAWVVLPWLVLELCTVLALTQLGIRQSDWWRAGIWSTNLHIVVELVDWPYLFRLLWRVHCKWSTTCKHHRSLSFVFDAPGLFIYIHIVIVTLGKDKCFGGLRS